MMIAASCQLQLNKTKWDILRFNTTTGRFNTNSRQIQHIYSTLGNGSFSIVYFMSLAFHWNQLDHHTQQIKAVIYGEVDHIYQRDNGTNTNIPGGTSNRS